MCRLFNATNTNFITLSGNVQLPFPPWTRFMATNSIPEFSFSLVVYLFRWRPVFPMLYDAGVLYKFLQLLLYFFRKAQIISELQITENKRFDALNTTLQNFNNILVIFLETYFCCGCFGIDIFFLWLMTLSINQYNISTVESF